MSKQLDSIKKNSYIIAACIIASRILGLLREMLLARMLGTTALADALRAAIRIPNILQNLLGEGVLSASFIPTYSRLHKENPELANQTAKQVGSLICLIAFIISALGMIFAPTLTNLLAAGFDEETKRITDTLITYLFPSTFFLVMSAWCLGVLNSHRHFFLSYAAPVVWNICVISGLLAYYNVPDKVDATVIVAKLFLLASMVQFLIQVPKTHALINLRSWSRSKRNIHTKEILRNLPIVITGRGIIQINSYFDTLLASFLSAGSLSSLMYAQTLYLLPISAFGLANAAASLPEFSEKSLKEMSLEEKDAINAKLTKTIKRACILTLITICGLIVLGHWFISLAFENSVFNEDSTNRVYYCLLTFLPGLIPATISRIKTSFLYACKRQDIVTFIACGRLVVNILLSLLLCFVILPSLHVPVEYFICGLGIAASLSNIIENIVINITITRIKQES